MSTACIPSTPILLHRPMWRRLLDQAVDAVQAARQRRQRARNDMVQRCLAAFRCWDSDRVAELDDHLLRDIGVPDWLREVAAARRQPDGLGAAFEGPLALSFSGGAPDRGPSRAAEELRDLGARW